MKKGETKAVRSGKKGNRRDQNPGDFRLFEEYRAGYEGEGF